MQENILEVLKENGPLKTNEISMRVGKKKAKDIQNVLDKLFKRDLITKSKVNTKLFWSLVEVNDSNEQYINHEIQEEVLSDKENTSILQYKDDSVQTDIVQIKSNESDNNAYEFIEMINNNLKEEVIFLRKEVDKKNDLVNSLQQIINILVSDQKQQHLFYQQQQQEQNFVQQRRQKINQSQQWEQLQQDEQQLKQEQQMQQQQMYKWQQQQQNLVLCGHPI